jgi:hypothetical protein
MSQRTLKTAFWTIGFALILIGSWAWIDRWVNGDRNTNYGSIVP